MIVKINSRNFESTLNPHWIVELCELSIGTKELKIPCSCKMYRNFCGKIYEKLLSCLFGKKDNKTWEMNRIFVNIAQKSVLVTSLLLKRYCYE